MSRAHPIARSKRGRKCKWCGQRTGAITCFRILGAMTVYAHIKCQRRAMANGLARAVIEDWKNRIVTAQVKGGE